MILVFLKGKLKYDYKLFGYILFTILNDTYH